MAKDCIERQWRAMKHRDAKYWRSRFLTAPMPPNHHHRRRVELAILEEQTTAVFPELRVGFVAEDQVLVDADCTGAVGDGVVVAFCFAERERGE